MIGNVCPARIVAKQYEEGSFHASLPHESAHAPQGGDSPPNHAWRVADGTWRRGVRQLCVHCGSLYVEEVTQ